MIVKSSELTRTRREVGRRNGKKGEKVLMGRSHSGQHGAGLRTAVLGADPTVAAPQLSRSHKSF